jgi:hypothetical protein
VTVPALASFEVERFELAGDACLEVRGRWFGVRGRRFMRPALTVMADGREQRVLAMLDHKPWSAEEGEAWLAAFPWSEDPSVLGETELTVAPDLTVPLPPPSSRTRGRRPRRAGATGAASRGAGATGDVRPPKRARADDPATHAGRLRAERDAALRSRDEAIAELDAVKRDRNRLGKDLREALAARDAAIAERYDAIEAEVSLRIADLRAEAERERAAAGLAAQSARERDTARAARDEASRERDEARAERDSSRHERNRLLAERDTARNRVEEVTRHWELAASRGTRRTQERDAVAIERDRLARERDAAFEQYGRTARQRDAALEQRDRAAGERDAAVEQRDQAVSERADVRDERQVTLVDLEAQSPENEHAERVSAPQPTERRPAEVETEVETEAPAQAPASRPPADTPRSSGARSPRRPPRPPAPAATRRADGVGPSREAGPTARSAATVDASDVLRTRLLAATALFVAVVLLLVILLAR